MDRDEGVNAGILLHVDKALHPGDLAPEHGLPVGEELNSRPYEIRARAAPHRRDVPLVSILNRKNQGRCARRRARGQIDRDCGVAERELVAVRGHDVFLGSEPLGRIVLRHGVPVRLRHDDLCGGYHFLKCVDAPVLVGVSVRDHGILDVRRIETELLQLVEQVGSDPFEVRVEQNDSRRRGQRPRGFRLCADVIEVVENSRRRNVPLCARRGFQFPLLARLQRNITADSFGACPMPGMYPPIG